MYGRKKVAHLWAIYGDTALIAKVTKFYARQYLVIRCSANCNDKIARQIKITKIAINFKQK